MPSSRYQYCVSYISCIDRQVLYTTSATWEVLYAQYIMLNARLDESQAVIKIAGRNINNLRYGDNTTLMAEKGRETKEPLDEGKRRK